MKYIRSQNKFSLSPDASINLHNYLPAGNYAIMFNNMTEEYYLEDAEDFKIPSRFYGKIAKYRDYILSAFQMRDDNEMIGALLSGEKGSGKSVLAKAIAVKSGLPVIIVNQSFSNDKFLRTLQNIPQDAIIIFDEFEKLYNSDQQSELLTVFDGVYTLRNKLVLLTCNDKYAVREFFHNRPARLRYLINFEKVPVDEIKEYCNDNLDDCSKYEKMIIDLSAKCNGFNFDMLQAICKEIKFFTNYYKKDLVNLDEIVEILNIKPVAINGKHKYVVKATCKTDPGSSWFVKPVTLGNTLLEMLFGEDYENYFYLSAERQTTNDEDKDSDGKPNRYNMCIRSSNLTQISQDLNSFIMTWSSSDDPDPVSKENVVFELQLIRSDMALPNVNPAF
jgi:hypothetical protein